MCNLSGLFGGGGSSRPALPAPPAAPPPVPTKTQPEVADAAARQARIRRSMIGNAGLLLTGGQGDTSIAPVAAKTLLGE